MQETVTNTKTLFSSFLEVLEAREKKAQADRQLQEEKYLRRTQRIYELHDRQRREAVELRRCLDYVSQHAHVLESVLRGAAAGEGGVPLGAALVRQAAALQRCMAQCVANAAKIRHLLAATHQPHMDTLLAKMEAELSTWTAFLQRAADATCNTEIFIDNLHNMIAEQRRCVREVSSSTMFASMCDERSDTSAGVDTLTADTGADAEAKADADADAQAGARSPLECRRAPSAACSTPIAKD